MTLGNLIGGSEAVNQPADRPEIPEGWPINWQEVYEVLLGIPIAEPGRLRLTQAGRGVLPGRCKVPVLRGVGCNKLVKAFRSLGVDVLPYDEDLDDIMVWNVRSPNTIGDYTATFAADMEPSPILCDGSAVDLSRRVKAATLEERLLLGLGVLMMDWCHLDSVGRTLCIGSCDADGNMPFVYHKCVSGERIPCKLCIGYHPAKNILTAGTFGIREMMNK